MYDSTVTIFNRSGSEKKGFVWFPTLIMGVNLIIDKGAGMAKTGLADANKANLHIRYRTVDKQIIVEGKQFLLPKEWQRQADGDKAVTLTFSEGEDFFLEGEYPIEPVSEDDILYTNGFFAYLKQSRDNVFKINTVGKYGLIPHFEIGGD